MKRLSPKIKTLMKDLAAANAYAESLRQQLEEEKSNLKIPCACGKKHKIKDCVAVQTHHYVSPYSCSAGDYWVEDELQFLCPDKEVLTRLLDHSSYTKVGFAEDFKSKYKRRFKEVVETHERSGGYLRPWSILYLDNLADYFQLVEREKPQRSSEVWI